MRTDVKNRLGRVSAAVAVGIVALTGAAATADAHDWRYQRYHHWNNGWAVNHGYYPYYHRSWDRGWTWGERYGAPPYGYYAPRYGYYAPRYYAPTYSYGLVVR